MKVLRNNQLMTRISIFKTILLISSVFISACGTAIVADTAQQNGDRVLSVMTHDSFSISEQMVEDFQSEHDVQVRFLKSGDTGTTVNKAILSKDKPLADVLYGVDNTFLSRALEEDIFEPYNSHWLSAINEKFQLDSEHRVLPVDFGDVCLNFDLAYFEDHGLTIPESLTDLLEPQYENLLVVENPATSSPGLAFLLATIGNFGDPGYLDFWQGLVDNNLLVVNDWEVAYYQEFSRSGGTRPIVVSYGSSPPFEVIYSETPISDPPTSAMVSDGACFRQIEFVGILKGTQNRDLAEKWIDFMLSPEFQEDIPLQMFVFPVNEQAQLDQVFEEHLAVPENPTVVSYDDIDENREKWINEWTQLVLR
jgi:thiamine transport system substrate-binding protein